MMTVVDHVRPWLTPSSTLAKSIQLQDGAHMSRNGTGAATSQPADEDALRPSVGEPAGEVVGERLGDAEDDDEREDRGPCREMEVLLGDRRQDAALHADHRADERVDDDEQRELREVRAEAERNRGGRFGSDAHPWL